jgi:single-strand DNA-binding protein
VTEQQLARMAKRRLAILRHAEEITGNLSLTCRYYGISRQCFYTWRRRYDAHGLDGLRDPSHRPQISPNATRTEVVGQDRPARQQEGAPMSEVSVSFAGNLTDDPEVRYTEAGIARAMFRVAVSGRRDQQAAFFAVIVWRDQAEHAAQSLSKGSRVVVVGRLQQRTWTAEDGSARQVVEVLAEELGPSLRWATATTTRATRSSGQ